MRENSFFTNRRRIPVFNKISPNLSALILLVIVLALGLHFFQPRESVGTVVSIYDPASVEVRGFRTNTNESVDLLDSATSDVLARAHLTPTERAILGTVLGVVLHGKEVHATWTPVFGYRTLGSSVSAGRASEFRIGDELYVEVVSHVLAAMNGDPDAPDLFKQVVREVTAE